MYVRIVMFVSMRLVRGFCKLKMNLSSLKHLVTSVYPLTCTPPFTCPVLAIYNSKETMVSVVVYVVECVHSLCFSTTKKVFSEGDNDVRVFRSLTSTRTLGTNTTQREIPRTEKDKHTPRGHTPQRETETEMARQRDTETEEKERGSTN